MYFISKIKTEVLNGAIYVHIRRGSIHYAQRFE